MNVGKMMKDLQKLQEKFQTDLESVEVEGSAGGGIVSVRMNGKKELVALKLAPEAITPDDTELMEDLILAAVNDAGRKADSEIATLQAGMTAGMKIPGLM